MCEQSTHFQVWEIFTIYYITYVHSLIDRFIARRKIREFWFKRFGVPSKMNNGNAVLYYNGVVCNKEGK